MGLGMGIKWLSSKGAQSIASARLILSEQIGILTATIKGLIQRERTCLRIFSLFFDNFIICQLWQNNLFNRSTASNIVMQLFYE